MQRKCYCTIRSVTVWRTAEILLCVEPLLIETSPTKISAVSVKRFPIDSSSPKLKKFWASMLLREGCNMPLSPAAPRTMTIRELLPNNSTTNVSQPLEIFVVRTSIYFEWLIIADEPCQKVIIQ
jgi:hypothetical protein